MGRIVPWAGWDEWARAKALLTSADPADTARGVELVRRFPCGRRSRWRWFVGKALGGEPRPVLPLPCAPPARRLLRGARVGACLSAST